MYGVFLFGYLSEQDDILAFMRDEVVKDDNWRVQEILAKSFDEFCKKTGYEKALPIIDEWLRSNNPNTRRAVTEGLRIWTSRPYFRENPNEAIERIAGHVKKDIVFVPQDSNLTQNQEGKIRCGDNGIFKGVPLTEEQKKLSTIAREIYEDYPFDGKYILDGERLIICQSHAEKDELRIKYPHAEINPLGYWTGGFNVDTGATNRKLGSDMADSITGGGLHGKDLSKADVLVNIYAFLKAQETKKTVELSCAIGDEEIDGKPYSEIVDIARKYIDSIGGFEKFVEWGLF